METRRTQRIGTWLPWLAVAALLLYLASPSPTQQRPGGAAPQRPDVEKGPLPSSYDQVSKVLLGLETFQQMMAKDKAEKDQVMARQQQLLRERYNLEPRLDPTVKMTR